MRGMLNAYERVLISLQTMYKDGGAAVHDTLEKK